MVVEGILASFSRKRRGAGGLGFRMHPIPNLRRVVLEIGPAGPAKQSGEFRPEVGCTHINHPDRLDPRPRRLDDEQASLLATLDAAPEFPFGGEQQVLV